MKKLICAFLIIFSVFSCVFAEEAITVKINDITINFDVAPQTVNGRTMVPVRAIFEALDATVSWDEATSGITAVKGDTKIVMHLNDTNMTVNDKTVVLDAAPFETGGRTLVPVRAISEAFECKVLWEEATQTVYIQTDVYTAAEISEKASPAVFYIESYDENDEVLCYGSGFFVSPDGKAVTTYDILDGASSTYIRLADGTVSELDIILNASRTSNIVVFTLKSDRTEFPYLKLADSKKTKSGDKIYILGRQKTTENILSEGIVNSIEETFFGVGSIQITAPISNGNGGSAVINENCELEGLMTRRLPSEENVGVVTSANIIESVGRNDFSITLDSLPKSYVDITTSEDYIELNQYKTAKALVTIDTNIHGDCKVYYEVINQNIIDVEIDEKLNNDTTRIEITGKKPGTAGIAFKTSTGYSDNFIIVNVYAPGKEIYEKVNLFTYTQITGEKCKKSTNFDTMKSVSGYKTDYDWFEYDYNYEKLNLYFEYLESCGFENTDTHFEGEKRLYTYSNFFYTLLLNADINNNIISILPLIN